MNRITVCRLIRREIQAAKLNTLLCLVVVVIASGLFVAMVEISLATVDATRVLMKQMGFNLLITPKGVDPARYQALDFQDVDMPEDYVAKLASSTGVMAQHFVGKFQKTIQVQGCTAVLTGVLTETPQRGTEKVPMPTAYEVPGGTVFLGSAVAHALGKSAGDTVVLMEKPFPVGRVLDEAGAMPEDIRIYAPLHDVQGLVGRPGRINAIDALACQCPATARDIIALLRRNIEAILPDVSVQPYHSILMARHEQRNVVQQLELAMLAIVIVGSAAAIWGLTYQNVRNRRYEVGVLRALGVPGWRIAVLFIGKILLYSVAGAVLGCVAGVVATHSLNVTGHLVPIPHSVFEGVLLVTPVAAVVFGLPPIVSRLLQEPTEALGDGAA
jgi:predicted lysophospholipase L1 biosynthesis ABC-type transport system permease subunit